MARVIQRGHAAHGVPEPVQTITRGPAGDETGTVPSGGGTVANGGSAPGPPGDSGEDGEPGPPGPPGAPGTNGTIGYNGEPGPPGFAYDGADGADGFPGARGPDGPPGAAGAMGPSGPAGPAGEDGADGADGAMGPPGPPGPEGHDGSSSPAGGGSPGPAGEDGDDGAVVVLASGGSVMFLDGVGNPQGHVPAPVGAIYMDRQTGRQWNKMAGGATKFGWYRQFSYLGGHTETWVIGFNPIIDSLAPNNQGSALHTGPWTGSRTSSVFESANGELVLRTDGSTSSGNVAYLSGPAEIATGILIARDWDLICRIATPNSITLQRMHVGLSTIVPIDADNFVADATVSSHIGFRWSTTAADAGWVPQTKNGASTLTIGTALNTITGGAVTLTTLRIRKISNVCYFSVDDGAEQSITTTVPTAGSYRFYQSIVTKSAATRSFWTRSIMHAIGVQ